MSTNNFLNVCPHCGFESEDDAICCACGRLYDEDLPIKKSSLSGIVFGTVSCIVNTGLKHLEKTNDNPEDDPWTDPGWSTLTGNIYNHDDEESSPISLI